MLDVKKLLTKMLVALKSFDLVVDDFTSGQQTLNANANVQNATISITKSGYKPLGIVGFAVNWVSGSTEYVNLHQLRCRTDTTAAFNAKNLGSAQVKFTVTVYVLYAKLGGGTS